MNQRPIRLIFYDSAFQDKYRKLPADIRTKIIEREGWFRADAFDARLRTHKLEGKLKDHWAYSVSHNPAYRIVFRFLKSDEVLLVDVGKHEEVYR